MREHEFREWFKSQGDLQIINFYVSGNRRIERDEKVDLDEEFKNNGLEKLLNRYVYSRADDKAKRPNPTNLALDSTSSIYSILSIHRSALRQYRRFCLSEGEASVIQETPDSNDDDTDIESTDRGAIFALKSEMQDAIRENIAQLEIGLKIIDGGVEHKVASGFIDILARDRKGHLVVIELNAGKARDVVIAQTLGYMGDLEEKEKQPVRGIIVAADFSKRVQSAARIIPNLELNAYSYAFSFEKKG